MKKMFWPYLELLKRTAYLDVQLSVINNIQLSKRIRHEALNRAGREVEVERALLAHVFQEIGIQGDEEKLNLSGQKLTRLGALGLKAAAKIDPKSYDPPLKWTKLLRDECGMFRFIKNGSFRRLTSLDVSDNMLTTLDNMHLERILCLKSLD